MNPANHIGWSITAEQSSDFIFGVFDPGNALRIRKRVAGEGSIGISGSAQAILFGPTTSVVDGDAGRAAYAMAISTSAAAVTRPR